MRNVCAVLFSLLLTFSLCCCENTTADKAEKTGKKTAKKDKKEKESVSPEVRVVKKWEMPYILTEVSGIAYISDGVFACIQDEAGAIFIYNTKTAKIVKQVNFGASADYEGIALAGKTAYVVRSDGKLYEVNNINSQSPKIKQYTTPLTAQHDVEGLTYDRKNNRLLLAIKGTETDAPDYKGIYAFNLSTKKLSAKPVFKIDLTDSVFQDRAGKKLKAAIQPSEIAINPVTQDIYITEATNPQLLILDAQGSVKARYLISNDDFPQPEGITFSPTGELFISNEGKKGKGNILKVEIDNL